MANKLFNEMQEQGQPQGDMMGNFDNFMQQMRGQNPRAIINQMVQSGRISQEQLNAVQQRAQQMGGMFSRIKSRYGF